MKKLCLPNIFLFVLLLLNGFAQAQTNKAASLQRKSNPDDKNAAPLVQKLNPGLVTIANAPVTGLADSPDVYIFPSSHVQSEVMIAISKANPKNLIASTNTLLGSFNYNQGFYSSSDGGRTWTGSDQLQKINGSTIDGDPSVAFSADGTGFLTSIAHDGSGTAGYWFQKSTDGGQNWSKGVKGNSGANLDKDMITADNLTTSPFANNFYATWTDFNSGNGAVALNRSTNKGSTFSSELILRSGAVGFGQGTNVQTGINGEVYVCWADHTKIISPYKANGLGFAKSTDGGVTFTPYSVIFPYKGTRVDNTNATYNHTRVNDFPSMAVDKSTHLHKGRIYITYPEANQTDGHSEIKVRFSDNGGTTWSGAFVVNIPNARQSFFPWICVDDKQGIVWVVYYAFDNASGYSTNTYVAASANGKTWVNSRVSDVAHVTAPIDNTNFAAGYAGDYIGIVAFNGVAHPVWMDNRNGQWQIYTSAVTAQSTLLNAVDEEEAPIAANKIVLTISPNPASNVLNLKLDASIKSVSIYYQSGMLARQWNSGDMQSLNVVGLTGGVYTINVIDKNGKSYSQQFMKE
jgi:hypothetical protein